MLASIGLLIAAFFRESKDNLVRALYTGLAIALSMDLIFLSMMLYTMEFKEQPLVVISSILMCAATGFFIVFDLVHILIPAMVDNNVGSDLESGKGDWILAVLNLYLDVPRLFYFLMMNLAQKSEERSELLANWYEAQ